MSPLLFQFESETYPSYLRDGNACQFVAPIALKFCQGDGLDVGCGKWPLPGSTGIDLRDGGDAMELPSGRRDFVFSSHCLEHLPNPVAALEHWQSRLKPGGVLFLYLPSEDQRYWRPERCRRHLHSWTPERMADILSALGFVDVMHSQRDLAWSFSVIGFMPLDVDAWREPLLQRTRQIP